MDFSDKKKCAISVKVELMCDGEVIDWAESSSASPSFYESPRLASVLAFHGLKDLEDMVRRQYSHDEDEHYSAPW